MLLLNFVQCLLSPVFACFALVSLLALEDVIGQDFVDLDFEQSTILSSTPFPGENLNFGIANVPGWTVSSSFGLVSNYSSGAVIGYNNPTLDAPGITLITRDFARLGRPVINGQFSLLLEGGDAPPGYGMAPSIEQTGQIPSSAKTIEFDGYYYDPLHITFNGNVLSFKTLQTYANYSVFGADISAYAGQTGELLITDPIDTGFMAMDDISFSTSEIPEPSVLTLSTTCFWFLCSRYRTKVGIVAASGDL